MERPIGRKAALCRVFLTSGTKFFQPLMPTASRNRRRRSAPPVARVAAVEGDVRLVGPELVLVVGEVPAPVERIGVKTG